MNPDAAKSQLKVRAIIFDLDGTLIDSSLDLADAVNHVRMKLGMDEASIAAVRGWIGDGMRLLVARAIGDGPPERLEKAIALFRSHYGAHCMDRTLAYPGVAETLAALHRRTLPMAVVSNKPLDFTRKLLDGLKLASYFTMVLGPESVKNRKPDPESFLLVRKSFDLPAARIAAVGDRSTDIEAGRAAGMKTVGVRYGLGDAEMLIAARPDVILDRIDELPDYMKE